MQPIKVLIVDDHPLLRDGLRKLLSIEPSLLVVADAGNGREAVEANRQFRPDIVLMDINMPVMNGIEATRVIRQETPDTGIIALTIHDDEAYVVELIQAGVSGYVLKDINTEELVRAIQSVSRGDSVIHPSVTKKVFGELRRSSGQAAYPVLEPLTERELEVLAHIAAGEANKIIADKLCISEKTVKNHISNIFRKLDVCDRTQAALYAVKHKIVVL